MCLSKNQQEDCGKATDCAESCVVLEVGYLIRSETSFPPILYYSGPLFKVIFLCNSRETSARLYQSDIDILLLLRSGIELLALLFPLSSLVR